MSTIHDKFEALTMAEVVAHLHSTLVGRVGFVVDGQPFVLPINYAADDCGNVVFRASENGLLSRLAGRVAFEVDGYNVQQRAGWSVHITGSVSDITDADDLERVRLRRLGVTPWAAGRRGRKFAITADELSGRRVAGRVVDEWFAGVPAS